MNREFVYDQSPRLEIEQIKDLSGTVLYGFEYWYDCAGRRTRKLEAGTRNTYYEYDSADRLTRSHHADGSWAYFHYDADGNTTSIECPSGGDAGPQGTTAYEWNQDGRMLSADVPGVATENEFEWNAFDQRTRVVDSTGDAVLLRDGQKLIGERTSGGVWRARYSNEGPSLYSSLLSDSRGGATRWPTFDALGSVLSWSDSSQAVTGSALWEAFGTRPASTGTLPGPFGYIGGLGYYLDRDLGLPLLSIRHYSPPRGMFLSRDPVLSEPRYGYVHGLPMSGVDPGGAEFYELKSDAQCQGQYLLGNAGLGPFSWPHKYLELWWDCCGYCACRSYYCHLHLVAYADHSSGEDWGLALGGDVMAFGGVDGSCWCAGAQPPPAGLFHKGDKLGMTLGAMLGYIQGAHLWWPADKPSRLGCVQLYLPGLGLGFSFSSGDMRIDYAEWKCEETNYRDTTRCIDGRLNNPESPGYPA